MIVVKIFFLFVVLLLYKLTWNYGRKAYECYGIDTVGFEVNSIITVVMLIMILICSIALGYIVRQPELLAI